MLWQDVGPYCEQTHAAFEMGLCLDQGQGVYSCWSDVGGSSQLRLCHTCIIDGHANNCIKVTDVQLDWFPSISLMPWPTKHNLHGHKVHWFVGRKMPQGMGNERIQLSLSICKAIFLPVSRQQHGTFRRFIGYVAWNSGAFAWKHRKKGFQSQWNVLFFSIKPTTLAKWRINA